MDTRTVFAGKVAAVVGLGICVMFVTQGRPPLDGVSSGQLPWMSLGLQEAPARAVLCLSAVAGLLGLAWFYRLLFCPLELLRTPEEVGYIVPDGRSRAQTVNQVRRRRKTGDLPPVYPNGWYHVLDSHLLPRGEVRSLCVLGTTLLTPR